VVTASQRDLLWEDCRNSLAIARLLVKEDRPQGFVATSCRLAVEAACRAALEQAGLVYRGDLEEGLARLGAPRDLWNAARYETGAERLAAAETAVAWMAVYLRRGAPERSWGF
jgi:hypothetical protein